MAATAMRHAEGDEVQARALPVIEIFGPTLQGEGPSAGQPSYFVRFGGCDYRCVWCDSMYAVEPSEVRANAESLTPSEIVSRVANLPHGPKLVVLSGGNPALLELGVLVEKLQLAGYEVAVETQGSRWRDWLAGVDQLIVSPKPPSSGMTGISVTDAFALFMSKVVEHGTSPTLKIVVFDDSTSSGPSLSSSATPRTPCSCLSALT